MSEIIKQSITTLEIADMMNVEHYEVLRKLDGTKKADGSVKQVGIIPTLTDGKIPVSDYFTESSYHDASGKENRCYKATKLGCDLLANKFNGEKGILFTAKYVKRFYELEHEAEMQRTTITYDYPISPAAMDSATNAGRLFERIMRSEGSAPHEVAMVVKNLFQQVGIEVLEQAVKIPAYEQLSLDILTGR